ncbi:MULTISPECIES: thioesterase family protein [Amycolatopsis]|uniref:Thioesterase family protein n=1 Tax=Amycolatopsis thermalba TaxID=944492 RepID=A0ABY4NNS7_9PSEU|nr:MULTISPECIES: thioesterase family protein [Amycolatopsis]OXM74228.1 aromatic compound degradation protein PaaI [Amycolatopsis sp. KNN50.9b]UQS22182.1 thioesterase family protein [Amycolatopsis thermalba]
MSAAEVPDPASFEAACAVRSLGDGTLTADLRHEWSIGGHPHGGFLIALMARAALAVLSERGEPSTDPLAVSAEFLRPPAIGPALLRTDIRKVGRRATVVAVRLEQRGRSCVEATVTTGRLPVRRADWADLPQMPVEPPPRAIHLAGETSEGVFNLAKGCDVRIDPATAGYLAGRNGDPPRLRLWVKPRYSVPDAYFALLAGDINPPVVFNLGRLGWAPTAQLTALVRARPAPGWLRVQVDCRTVQEAWFDSDATVIDSAGRLVCQARQLALAPAP